MRVDLKSFILGAILVLVLFVVIGQTTKQSKPIGRYQIIMSDPDSGIPPAFLLDTKTGISYLYYIIRDSTGRIIEDGWTPSRMNSMAEKIWKTHYEE